jgi:uncharacterized protein (DUF362 family)
MVSENMKIKRREFLKLAGCSPLVLTLSLTPACEESNGIASKVALVKNSDESFALARAIELAGGLDFLAPGDSVLLKLALNSSSPFPATTSPEVVSGLVTLLKDQGAGDIFVGDKSPTWTDTMSCLQETGIYDAALGAGAEIVVFEDDDMVPVAPDGAVSWPDGFSVPGIFDRVDHIIALPTLRTHGMADFTMGMKIFVGALPQDDRFKMHESTDFLKAIAEIALCTDKIRLSVLDARQGFNRRGPDSGDLIEPGIMIASRNLVAADAAGLALIKTTDTTDKLKDQDVWEHPTIQQGIRVLSPDLSVQTLQLVSEGVDEIDDIAGLLGIPTSA